MNQKLWDLCLKKNENYPQTHLSPPAVKVPKGFGSFEVQVKRGGRYLGGGVDPNSRLSWVKNKIAMGELVRSSSFLDTGPTGWSRRAESSPDLPSYCAGSSCRKPWCPSVHLPPPLPT